MDNALMALLKFGFAFFIGVCILLWAFKPGHTWLYFMLMLLLIPILFGWVFGKAGGKIFGRQIFLLAFFALLLWFLFRHSSIDDAIQSIGRAFPQKVTDQASKRAEKYLQSKNPFDNIDKAVQAGNKLTQNDINQCYRDVIAANSKNYPEIAKNSALCTGKTGQELQTCMDTKVFSGTDLVMDANRCQGASTSAGPVTQNKLANYALGALFTAACDVAELANYFPFVNIPTSKCPD